MSCFMPEFRTLAVDEARRSLDEVCRTVAANRGRVYINAGLPDHACVLMSLEELAAMEQALELYFSESDAESIVRAAVFSELGQPEPAATA